MDQRGDMRASDADRQGVADQLRRALDEGRLDLHEYDERLQRAYAAKTYADLGSLLADLPGTVSPDRARVAAAPPPPAAPASGRSSGASAGAGRGWLAAAWGSYLKVVAVTTAIWLVTSVASGDLGYFWPIWVAGPWGAVLLVSTIGGLFGGASRHWQPVQGQWHGHHGGYAARGRARRGC
jgi:Domain of unknown function (DUF1707)